MHENIEYIISNARIFGGLSGRDIKAMSRLGEKKHWPRGSQIIREGDKGDALYIILSGKVKVVLYGEEGREIILSVMKKGDVFGEMSLLDGEPRSANVEALEDAECFVISGEAFLNYIKNNSVVALAFLSYLSKRIREADKKIGGLALLDVCGRVAHTLLDIARAAGSLPKAGTATIERLTHEEIASMIGSSREVVSRALKKMASEGYIKIDRKNIVLHI